MTFVAAHPLRKLGYFPPLEAPATPTTQVLLLSAMQITSHEARSTWCACETDLKSLRDTGFYCILGC